MYPPITDPANAHDAKMIGELAEEERKAVSNRSTRSVLPGNGMGTTDESTIARANSPTPPRCISQPRKPDDFFPAIAPAEAS